MIQAQVKLRLSATKEAQLNEWLWHLTSVHNFAVLLQWAANCRRRAYHHEDKLNMVQMDLFA